MQHDVYSPAAGILNSPNCSLKSRTSIEKEHAHFCICFSDHIKNAHHRSKTRQIGGVKRAQPRVDSINIKYPYTLFISHDLGSVPPLTLQVAQ